MWEQHDGIDWLVEEDLLAPPQLGFHFRVGHFDDPLRCLGLSVLAATLIRQQLARPHEKDLPLEVSVAVSGLSTRVLISGDDVAIASGYRRLWDVVKTPDIDLFEDIRSEASTQPPPWLSYFSAEVCALWELSGPALSALPRYGLETAQPEELPPFMWRAFSSGNMTAWTNRSHLLRHLNAEPNQGSYIDPPSVPVIANPMPCAAPTLDVTYVSVIDNSPSTEMVVDALATRIYERLSSMERALQSGACITEALDQHSSLLTVALSPFEGKVTYSASALREVIEDFAQVGISDASLGATTENANSEIAQPSISSFLHKCAEERLIHRNYVTSDECRKRIVEPNLDACNAIIRTLGVNAVYGVPPDSEPPESLPLYAKSPPLKIKGQFFNFCEGMSRLHVNDKSLIFTEPDSTRLFNRSRIASFMWLSDIRLVVRTGITNISFFDRYGSVFNVVFDFYKRPSALRKKISGIGESVPHVENDDIRSKAFVEESLDKLKKRRKKRSIELAILGVGAIVILIGISLLPRSNPRSDVVSASTSTTIPRVRVGGLEMGDKAVLSNKATIQLIGSEKFEGDFDREEFTNVAFDVEFCGGNDDPTVSGANVLERNFFSVHFTDNANGTGSTVPKKPELNAAIPNKGECVRGWISFRMLDEEIVDFMRYENYQGDQVTWNIE